MASDGVIQDEEVALIRKLCGTLPEFKNVDFEAEINRFVAEINAQGKQFITDYLRSLENLDLTEDEILKMLDIAIQVIKADNVIEYSEIKFFKNIRYRLKISDERISSSFLADKNDDLYLFLGEDIKVDISLDEITQQYLNTVEFGGFVLKT
jgi:tellurite resistance protein